MIKDFNPQPFAGINTLPVYVNNTKTYFLTAEVTGGYEIILAKLTTGASMSAGNPLSHALFESFTDHGRRAKAARTRVSGPDGEFIAVKNAMMEVGIRFHPALPNSCETILYALGEWFQVQNPEISAFSVVSQNCH